MRFLTTTVSFVLCLVVLTTARDVFADAPLVGGLIEESGGPITTIQATPLEAGSFFADIMVEQVVFNRYTDTQLDVSRERDRKK